MLVDSAVSTVLQPSFAFLPKFGADINVISENEVQHDLSGADGIR